MVEGGVQLRLKRGTVCALLKSLVGWWESLQEVGELGRGAQVSNLAEYQLSVLSNVLQAVQGSPSCARFSKLCKVL